MPENLLDLTTAWLDAKAAEKKATDYRRALEDRMLSYFGVVESLDGTVTNELDNGVTVKIVGRLTRKVDADKLQEIAVEHGLQDHLSSLFRWKPEINMAVWKNAGDNITRPLMAAITTAPGRPSFNITKKD
jgi:hypothetical protein